MAPLGSFGSVVTIATAARRQAETVLRLPGEAWGAVVELRDAARALQRVADRVDAVLDELEEPVRAVAPTLTRLARLLEDPRLADAPETMARLRDEVLPALRGIRETQQRVAALPGAAALLMRRAQRPPDDDVSRA